MTPIIVSIVGWLALALPQAPADFSGRWTMATEPVPTGPAAASARGDLGSGWGPTVVITQDARQLVVETVRYSTYDMQPQPKFVYALNGAQSFNAAMMGRGMQEQSSRAAWQGAALVITTTHRVADPSSGTPAQFTVTQKLSLESPTSLVVEATRSGAFGGRGSTTRAVYTKSPQS